MTSLTDADHKIFKAHISSLSEIPTENAGRDWKVAVFVDDKEWF